MNNYSRVRRIHMSFPPPLVHSGLNCSELVAKVSQNMPSPETISQLGEFFKILGDPTRVRILSALTQSELCVNDIAEVLGMERTAISHQLRILRTAHLVKSRRNGKMICYSFDDDHVNEIISQATDHIRHTH